jgi:ABC-type uncharacterized transport system ATPase subunit
MASIDLRLFAEVYNVEEEEYLERMDSLLRMFDLKEKQDTNAVIFGSGR